MRRSLAHFHVATAPDCTTKIIIDLDGLSVLNDAGLIVHEVLRRHGNVRIISKDTDGSWREFKHDGYHLTGFSPLTLEDLQQFKRK